MLPGETFIAIRAYLDRSGQPESSYITLAAFAGHDDAWAEFKRDWDQTLSRGFRPVDYFHMKDALRRAYNTPFSYTLGWKNEHIWELAYKLVECMSRFQGGRLTTHSCVVDMNAWRDSTAAGWDVPSEIDLCNRYVSEYIVAQYARRVLSDFPSGDIRLSFDDLLSFVFDRSENFRRPFEEFINREKEKAEQTGVNSIWQLVDGIGEGEMRQTPGIQAADMLAWGINRENTAPEGEAGKVLAYLLRQVVMSTSKEYDRAALLAEFGPPLPKAAI